MRIRIEQNKGVNLGVTVICPSYFPKERTIGETWHHYKINDLAAVGNLVIQNRKDILSSISIVYFESDKKIEGWIKFPLPVDLLVFEVLAYSVKQTGEKKVGPQGMPPSFIWKMNELEICVTEEQFRYLKQYLGSLNVRNQ